MTTEELAQVNGYKTDIAEISAIQAITGADGAKVAVVITDGNNNVTATRDKLIAAIGESAYNTICGAALSSLDTQLSTQKSSLQTSLDAFVGTNID